MIFDISRNAFESEKERNLYTKFFAGYFLNEFVRGYEDRVNLLSEIITKELQSKKIISSIDSLILKYPHVSFDNHSYLMNNLGERGEFADVLIHDPINKIMIAIEVKFLSNFSIEKDCEKNLNRINEIRNKNNDIKLYYFLLISEKKWKNAELMKNHLTSSITRYKNTYSSKIGLLFWEDLIALCTEKNVVNFMNERLSLIHKPKSARNWSASSFLPALR